MLKRHDEPSIWENGAWKIADGNYFLRRPQVTINHTTGKIKIDANGDEYGLGQYRLMIFYTE